MMMIWVVRAMTTMVIIAYIPKKVVFGLANFPRLGVVLFSCGERIGSVSVLHSYEIETLYYQTR